MIARIIWLAGLLVVALVAIAVHLDRQSARTPTLAESVPGPARSAAQLAITGYAFDRGSEHQALIEAEKLVRARPLPAEHLAILAQAQIAAGAADQGVMTIQYAAQRGWRDPLAQESMLRLALEAGDTAEAARRYTALFLRRDTDDALLRDLGAAVLAEPEGIGRQTLATIVGGGERWHSQFLLRGARVMPEDAFVEIVVAAAGQGAEFDCATLEQARETVQRNDTRAGADLAAFVAGQCS